MIVNELRVGNYILFKLGGEGKGKIGSMKRGDFGRFNDSEYHPIPLTPEWLERCGLVKVKEEDSNSYLSYSILKLDGVIAKQEDGWYQMITDIDGYHEQNVGVKLEFVHQLQNRYQSLAGEELNVKL